MSFRPARLSALLEHVYDDSASRHADIRVYQNRPTIVELTACIVIACVVRLSEGWYGANRISQSYDEYQHKHRNKTPHSSPPSFLVLNEAFESLARLFTSKHRLTQGLCALNIELLLLLLLLLLRTRVSGNALSRKLSFRECL